MIYQSKNILETKNLARRVAAGLKGEEVLCLYGNLGTGKTVFASGVINFFLPGKRVLSPTFIIVRHYLINKQKIKNIYHIDLYRLKSEINWKSIGLDEILKTPESVVIIEWADRLEKFLPEKRMDFKFNISDNDIRIINVNYQ